MSVSKRCVLVWLVALSSAAAGCSSSKESTPGGGSCSNLQGTWVGNELDPSGRDRGAVTFVVQDDRIVGSIADYGTSSESYTLAVTCNATATPNQISGTIPASDQAGAIGQRFYGIYEVDQTAGTGRLSGFQPGSTTFPTTFAAGNGQRLFVFGGLVVVGAGGSTSTGGSISTGSAGGAAGSGGMVGAGGGAGTTKARADAGGCGGSSAVAGPAWAMWKMPNPLSTGLPNPQSYTVVGDAVRDNVTGLVWQRDAPASSFSWEEAKNYCASLALAGCGWRLPSRIELVSLLDMTKASSIDTDAFPNGSLGSWSSSLWAGGPGVAWLVGRSSDLDDLVNTHSVRCVR